MLGSHVWGMSRMLFITAAEEAKPGLIFEKVGWDGRDGKTGARRGQKAAHVHEAGRTVDLGGVKTE